MRYSSCLYTGLLSFAFLSPAFANDQPSNEMESASTPSRTQKIIQKINVNATATQDDETKDPLESFNRKIYGFNDVVDRNVARPLAVQYVEKVPKDVRGGYRQFRKNLNEPWYAVNQLIQGRPLRAAQSLGRFGVNTLTSLGFADVATRMNLNNESESFGTTLGYYGVPSGPYLVLPVFGPSTFRDTFGLAVDSQARLQKYMFDDHEAVYWSEQLLRGIDARSELLDLEKVLQGDKYAQIRDIYLQRTNFEIAEKKGLEADNLFISDDNEQDFVDEDTSSDVINDNVDNQSAN